MDIRLHTNKDLNKYRNIFIYYLPLNESLLAKMKTNG